MSAALQRFLGVWDLRRTVSNGVQFVGQARIAPVEGGAVYAEEGLQHLPGQPPVRATQRYTWRADGKGIAVYFTDGRFFHRFQPGTCCTASHVCPPDFYEVRYDFGEGADWQTRWVVRGPRKDYQMTSFYSPAAVAALTQTPQEAMAAR